MSKKLVNQPENCVDEALEGLTLTHSALRILGQQRVVIDKAGITAGKVSIVAGGGSGHEPFAAGFVGKGLLSAAVAGSVFSSPSAGQILAAIRSVRPPDNCGVLLIVINYTGDRLNFGLALERARSEGTKVEMVVCGDDCCQLSANKAVGRRGLAGSLFLMKVAAALADRGYALESIVDKLKAARQWIGTIGASLTSCSIPGSGPLFQLADNELELGLGIHGEAGIKRVQMVPASDIMTTMLERMTEGDSSCSLPLPSGSTVVIIVNNLGGLAIMEMYIAAREAIRQLENRGVNVVRCYVGHLMTSMDMRGVQISVFKLNELLSADDPLDWLNLLDAPTSAPSWPHVFVAAEDGSDRYSYQKLSDEHCRWRCEFEKRGPWLDDWQRNAVQLAIRGAAEALEQHTECLNDLDSGCGDGDCGSTLKRWADIVRSTDLELSSPFALLQQLSALTEGHVGGTTGAIYSIFFASASHIFKDESEELPVTWNHWLAAGKLGLSAVMKYGKAQPGDRSLIDALYPALNRFADHTKVESSLNEILDALLLTCSAAEDGAQGTAGMRAKIGRASYVSEDLLSRPDPGAVAVSIWLRGAVQALNSLRVLEPEPLPPTPPRSRSRNRSSSSSSSSSSDSEPENDQEMEAEAEAEAEAKEPEPEPIRSRSGSSSSSSSEEPATEPDAAQDKEPDPAPEPKPHPATEPEPDPASKPEPEREPRSSSSSEDEAEEETQLEPEPAPQPPPSASSSSSSDDEQEKSNPELEPTPDSEPELRQASEPDPVQDPEIESESSGSSSSEDEQEESKQEPEKSDGSSNSDSEAEVPEPEPEPEPERRSRSGSSSSSSSSSDEE